MPTNGCPRSAVFDRTCRGKTCLRIVNSGLPREAQPWSLPRLIRAAKTFVREGLLPETILSRATASDKDDRLPAIVAGIKGADPRDDSSSHLRPARDHARTDAARSNQVAALIGQDALGTRRKAWFALNRHFNLVNHPCCGVFARYVLAKDQSDCVVRP